jgi:uncharacterized protein with HEPN domain
MRSMPSKSPLTALRDILHHIELAERFVTGFDNKAFLADVRTIYAVTRCLEVISEASRRLPTALKARHPSIPWKDIAGAGNIYRHDYEDVVAQYIWDTVKLALPPLQVVIQDEIDKLSKGSNP